MLEYNKKELGKFLKKARKTAALTQAEVAQALGYSCAQFISNIERGVSVAPLQTLSRMATLYKVNPDKISEIILTSQRVLLMKSLSKAA